MIALTHIVTLLRISEFQDVLRRCLGDETTDVVLRNLSAGELRMWLPSSILQRLIQLFVEFLIIRQDRIDLTLKTVSQPNALAEIPDDLPREVRTIDVPEDQRQASLLLKRLGSVIMGSPSNHSI